MKELHGRLGGAFLNAEEGGGLIHNFAKTPNQTVALEVKLSDEVEDVKKMIQDKVRCRFGDVCKIFGWKGAEMKRRGVGVWSHERHVRKAAKWRSSQELEVQQTARASESGSSRSKSKVLRWCATRPVRIWPFEAFGGKAVARQRRRGPSTTRSIRKFERFLVEFKKVCGMSHVLVEDLDREVRDAGGRSKEGRSEEPNREVVNPLDPLSDVPMTQRKKSTRTKKLPLGLGHLERPLGDALVHAFEPSHALADRPEASRRRHSSVTATRAGSKARHMSTNFNKLP